MTDKPTEIPGIGSIKIPDDQATRILRQGTRLYKALGDTVTDYPWKWFVKL